MNIKIPSNTKHFFILVFPSVRTCVCAEFSDRKISPLHLHLDCLHPHPSPASASAFLSFTLSTPQAAFNLSIMDSTLSSTVIHGEA